MGTPSLPEEETNPWSKTTMSENPFLEMQRLMASTPDPIIFDVGAYDGHVSLVFRHLFPTATIYAFEPFVDSFRQLWVATAPDPKIYALNYGLSSQAGKCQFNANHHPETNSLLSFDPAVAEGWDEGKLETTAIVEAEFKTIDMVMAELNIPRIDILKIDVQGAEHLVVEGAASACENGLINLVYSEIIAQPVYVGLKRFDEALGVLYDRGFDLYRLYNFSVNAEGRLIQADAIFTRKESEAAP